MARVKGRDTAPEMIVRSLLHRLGFRFRLHRKDLPGKPDIVLPKYKTVIFVHGCFWHQHEDCKASVRPTSNIEYWSKKLDRNIARDEENKAALKAEGWHVVILWECEIKDTEGLRRKLPKLICSSQRLPQTIYQSSVY